VDWIKVRQGLFPTPATVETQFVAGIFAVPAFQALVKQEEPAQGLAPWLILG